MFASLFVQSFFGASLSFLFSLAEIPFLALGAPVVAALCAVLLFFFFDPKTACKGCGEKRQTIVPRMDEHFQFLQGLDAQGHHVGTYPGTRGVASDTTRKMQAMLKVITEVRHRTAPLRLPGKCSEYGGPTPLLAVTSDSQHGIGCLKVV